MYLVNISTEGRERTVHGISEKLYSGKVVKGINSIDSFAFSMLPSNAGFGLISPFMTRVSVYNTRKRKYEFVGRALYSETSMSEDGLITKDATCESVFGYLCDSQQAYVEPKNWTVEGLLTYLINHHNSQVEEYKRFKVGEVTATDPNNNLYEGIQRENTWDAINSKLIKKIGGELRYRVEEDGIYIDYLDEIGETRATEIALSVNMKSITREQNPTEYITRLIPLGCKLSKTDESTGESKETEERLDISAVNNGLNYIDDEKAIAAYGIHVGYVEFDDVTTASALLRKGKAWMAENNKVQVKYSITALDLSLLGLPFDEFEVHNWHPIKNALIGVNDMARIIKQSIDVCEEVKSSIEVGDNFKTLTDIQKEQMNQLKDDIQNTQSTIVNLGNRVDHAEVELREITTEQSTTIASTCNEIVMAAMKAYTEKTTHEEFRQTVEAQLQLLADEMVLQFSQTNTHIEDVNGDLNSKINTFLKCFTISADGLVISASDSPFCLNLDNDRQSISFNGVDVLFFDATGRGYVPDLTVDERFSLLGYVIEQDADGNVNCEYVG